MVNSFNRHIKLCIFARKIYIYFIPSSKFNAFNIGIKHAFSCINVCQVPREMLKTEAEGRDFQQLPRVLANVNTLENNVWSLLLHKFNHNAKKITKNGLALFSTSSQLPCLFLHALSISIKSSFQAMVAYRDLFPTVSRFSQVYSIFTHILIQSRLLCHFFTISESA